MKLPVRYIYLIPAVALLAGFLVSCSGKKIPPMKIALSKAAPNYIHWIRKADTTVVTMDCYGRKPDSALALLKECSGLVITGGEDVDPVLYGKGSDSILCGTIDHYRDTLELDLIREAVRMNLPLLCICRGEQILNVAFGGDLIADIPTQYGMSVIHKCEDYKNCFHKLKTEPGTLLHSIVGCDSGFVNTNHHQAICNPAPSFRINAWATDGLPEGIEWSDPKGKAFLLGVQWHPERMDTSNCYSGKLIRAFLEQCREYSTKGK
ncbi:MAG TPA: gamma-glutamyl-gamma-aminobutyrate hydrolase family protein [Bacteroidales bacterium]|nr:gamma-glutamyl-gamma-aminobutyrate hydrolase family protein [Bacteroidales bacterium]